MNIDIYSHIYFLGIGGAGMSALARYFHAHGKKVSGYDQQKTPLSSELEELGITIYYQDAVEEMDVSVRNATFNQLLVIYTPAIDTSNNQQYQYFVSKGINVLKRSEVLGLLTRQKYTVAIAGTHGKTTTTALLAHMLKSAEIDCTVFLGGMSKDFNSNLILGKKGNIIVVEADEFDRSFHTLYPDVAVITSLDADHLDIYKSKYELEHSFQKFASQLKQNGFLLVQAGIETAFELPNEGRIMTYAAEQTADYFAENICITNHQTTFDIAVLDILPGMTYENRITNLEMSMPGVHNVENVLAAAAVACYLGATCDQIKRAVSTFQGVKRRYDKHIDTPAITYIDDYAHHPKEIESTILAVRGMYPNKKIFVVFQPHLFSRTQDMADEFAKSLSLADELLLLEIYPAREKPIAGVSSSSVAEKCTVPNSVCKKEELLSLLQKKDIEVLLTMGAGDIDTLVEPIKSMYLS